MFGGVGRVGFLDFGPRKSFLVGPGFLRPPFALTRAQASSASSTGLGSDGATYQAYAADIARFNGTAQRLLIEGARTNSVPNPRCEGATGSTPPTGWTLSTTRGLTHTYTRTTRNGVEGILWQMSGTPNATSGTTLSMEPGETSTAGRTCTLGVFVELVAGSTTNFSSLSLRQQLESAGGATALSPSATFRRVTNTTTAVGTNYRASISFAFANTTTPVDITLFLGWPSREMDATFASSAILPVANTPAASVRSADLVSSSLTNLGIRPNAACTIWGRFMIPQAAPSAATQVLLHLDDGSDTNRIMLRNSPGSSNIVLTRTTGGSALDSLAQAITPGTSFTAGITVDGAGNAFFSVNGAAALGVTGTATSGFTTLRLGANSSGDATAFSEFSHLRALPYAVNAAQLQTLVARVPA